MPQGDKPGRDPKRPDQNRQPDRGTPPAAGPHAKPRLTDPSKTPGSGTLPDPARPEDGDATSG